MASTSLPMAFCDSTPRSFHSTRALRRSSSRSRTMERMSSRCLWFLMRVASSSDRVRATSSSPARMLASYSALRRRASAAIMRSWSRICASRATIISCWRCAALRASSSSRRRNARSPSSKARLARSASSSAFLSASFSCMARSLAISISRASFTAASSSSRARRLASSALRYATIFLSSAISSSFRFFLMRMASSLAASTEDRCSRWRSDSWMSLIFSSSALRSISTLALRCSSRIASRSFTFNCLLYSICRSISARSLCNFKRRCCSRSLCRLIWRNRSSSISMSRTRSASFSRASRSSFSATCLSRIATVCAYRILRVIVLTSSSISSRWCADSFTRASLDSFSSCSSTVNLRLAMRFASSSSMCALRALEAARVASMRACTSARSRATSSRDLMTVEARMRSRSERESTAETGNASRTVAGASREEMRRPVLRSAPPDRALPEPPKSDSSTCAPRATVR
mmetsp:Transcript_20346/g.48072  ORF Transcript_20346/g.48072 Transcript_20346/m.48072 type:complete len:463 (+) Transcript_20346:194-1582(+)